ncbi:hypothetical protein [Myroides indicus]|uniref:Uncharacterized protein n=1 Tax=Myroides indicus TaxID=1323422 RepID=A0A4V3E7Y9_9FLAO|nr:hypothetical protein [Myroides indicus]TDS54653.1 hypothetical protein C8P70_12449 [Myroides indicus]
MKIRVYILSAFLTLGLFSCKDTQKEAPAIEDTELSSTTSAPETPAQNEALEKAPATNNQTADNLNPAHGQPGHRCDIPVGAPLDTPPQQNNMQQQPVQAAASSSNGNSPFLVNDQAKSKLQNSGGSAGTTASGKVNPPHGQPGHRCDIPVGQPL